MRAGYPKTNHVMRGLGVGADFDLNWVGGDLET